MKQFIQKICNPYEGVELLRYDYSRALFTSLWYREGQSRTLVFCSVELLPPGFHLSLSEEEQSLRVNASKPGYLYFKRSLCSIDKALNWYSSLNDDGVLMIWDENKPLEKREYFYEPEFPELSLSNEIPFSFKRVDSCRVSTAFCRNFPSVVRDFINNSEVAKDWCRERLCFDLAEFSEYLGSINLIAYNPLMRSVETLVFSNVNEKGGEIFLLSLEPYPGIKVSGLKLVCLEKRPWGYGFFREITIESNVVQVMVPRRLELLGYFIICPKRGLIHFCEFTPYIRRVEFRTHMTIRKNVIHVPTKDGEGIEEIYETPVYDDSEPNVTPGKKLHSFLDCQRKIKYQRDAKKEAKKSGQQIFYKFPEKAKKHIREIVSQARSEVWFIDPYFLVPEIFSFAFSAGVHKGCQVKILTGAREMNKEIKGKTQGEVIYQNIRRHRNEISADVYLMRGAPVFHDRFIIIDGKEVWLSGNSFGNISERLSLFLRLPDPTSFLEMFTRILDDRQEIGSLENWINMRASGSTEESNDK